jgi:hypothetical protein
MKSRRALLVFLYFSAAAACASPGIPPGGPVDTNAPKLLKIAPDSGRTGISPKEVVFHFDKVVSERPPGAPSLAALFLISPRDGTPKVDWHRSEVAVRPRRGWKPNTPYTIIMLPGMTDLRGNVRNTGAVTIFSTGSTIPSSYLTGSAFNWVTGAAAPRAFVEARPTTDTTTDFVAIADSTGTFRFPNLPSGTYRVRAILDDNNNKGLDPREAWDTATVTVTDSARAELYAFPHDSVAPRVSGVGIRDSVTLEILFDHPIDPSQTLTPASITIKTADSTALGIASVSRPGAATDSVARPIAALIKRGIPSTSLIVKLAAPLRTATTIRVRALNIRGLDGISGSTERVERVDPNPPAPPAAPPPPPPPPPPAGVVKR